MVWATFVTLPDIYPKTWLWYFPEIYLFRDEGILASKLEKDYSWAVSALGRFNHTSFFWNYNWWEFAKSSLGDIDPLIYHLQSWNAYFGDYKTNKQDLIKINDVKFVGVTISADRTCLIISYKPLLIFTLDASFLWWVSDQTALSALAPNRPQP